MKQKNVSAIAVLGAGSWGTALANQLASNHQTVYLWGRDQEQIDLINNKKINPDYLPDLILPKNLIATTNLQEALENTSDILVVVPSLAFREVLLAIKNIMKPQRLAWATKGLDYNAHQLLHIVVKEIFGSIPVAVLAGPNFAKEVAKGLPTAVTLATTDTDFATNLTNRLHSKNFRIYTSDDIIGVEIGSAMKNVLAIAVGIADGLGLGANARAAIITRGLSEMIRLGMALGAKQETFIGLSGVGDLVLTCTDNQSRNRRFGLALGQGLSRKEAEKTINQVIEGVTTTQEIYHLAKSKKG